MLELILSATRAGWQVPAHHGTEQDASKDMKAVRPKVLARDKNECQFCGFVSPKWQEIHHINDNHSDHSLSNLTTACPFCHQCFHLGLAGSTAGGILIWLPELGQAELNHLSRAAFIAMRDENCKLFASASALMTALETRAAFLDNHFTPLASDPAFLGQAFLKMSKDDYAGRKENLKNIRLLPNRSRFEPQIKYWAESVYRDLTPETWERLTQTVEI